MKNYYKIAIVGFGSIGKRHLNNLVDLLTSMGVLYCIDIIRHGINRAIPLEFSSKIDNVYVLSDKIPNDYDIVFVTNTTSAHYDTIRMLTKHTTHMFIEKPVFDDCSLSIENLNFRQDGKYYVACPLRYTSVMQYLKKEIDLRKVHCARAICSSYLPEWRPNIDYRKTYSANQNAGGGVCLDLIHEWDYIRHLFGDPSEVKFLCGRFSDLEISSNDLALYIARYESMMVEVHLDYFGKKAVRELQLFTSEDTIVADLISNSVHFLSSDIRISFNEGRNESYVEELKEFFKIIDGVSINENDIECALKTLKIAKGEWN